MQARRLRFGFIGTGDMGLPMVQRMAAAGHDLLVWNRTARRTEPLRAQGVAMGTSPAALAEACDAIQICVDSPDAIQAVLFGPKGIATASRIRAKLLVDHSTTSPILTRSLAAQLHEQTGMSWLDAPVSGGPIGARQGTLAVMAGGSEADLAMVRALFTSFAGRVTLMGALGAGQATKACNQIINFSTAAGLAEALAFGRQFDLDVTQLPTALAGGFADSNFLREYARATMAGEKWGLAVLVDALAGLYQGKLDHECAGRLGILLKDIGIILEAARESGCPAPVTAMLDGNYRTLHFQRR